MLWLWDDAPLPAGQIEPVVIPSTKLRKHPVTSDIRTVNAFLLWAISRDTRQVILDDGRWLASLGPDDRAAVREKQVTLNRGLCIPVERVAHGLDSLEAATFRGKLVLDRALWQSLPEQVQRHIILTELPLWDDADVRPVPAGTPPHIAAIANRFILEEGINCLAVTTYAITEDAADLHRWLQTDEFDDVLRDHGYRETADGGPASGDVLAWYGDDGIVHACYVLGPDRVVNKSGQSSFNPIRIVDVATVEREWEEHRLVILRRGG